MPADREPRDWQSGLHSAPRLHVGAARWTAPRLWFRAARRWVMRAVLEWCSAVGGVELLAVWSTEQEGVGMAGSWACPLLALNSLWAVSQGPPSAPGWCAAGLFVPICCFSVSSCLGLLGMWGGQCSNPKLPSLCACACPPLVLVPVAAWANEYGWQLGRGRCCTLLCRRRTARPLATVYFGFCGFFCCLLGKHL